LTFFSSFSEMYTALYSAVDPLAVVERIAFSSAP
jgi:hypothetical protein